MNRKVFFYICGIIAIFVLQVACIADTSVPFIRLDKEVYEANELMTVHVFNVNETEKISIEIVWEDTGNIVYKEEVNSSTSSITAPANSGTYICNIYIDSDKYSKSFRVENNNISFALSGNLMENDSGNIIGIRLNWTANGENSQYLLKRMDNTLNKIEYNITTDYFLDVNISPNKTYRYTISNGENISNEIIISTSEFVQSGSVLSHNNKCMMLTVKSPIVYNDGKEFMIDEDNSVYPIIYNDRVVLPIRSVVEGMGGTVIWNDALKTVTIKAWGHTVDIPVNSINVSIDGKSRRFDTPAIIRNDRTLVPLRHLELLGCEVIWNSSDETVTIIYQ